MSSDSHAFDPYRSPAQPEVPYHAPPTTGRPGWLTTLCVLCIVLGALGLFNSLIGTAGAIAGPFIQKAFQPKAGQGMPDDMQKAQEDFQTEINAVQNKYFWGTMPALGFRFVVALLLLIGGIRTLSMVEPGRKLLLIACSVAIVFELAFSILQSIISLDTMTIVNEYVVKMTATMPQNGNGPDMSQILPTVVRASVIASLVFAYLISLAKIGLYIFGLVYLRKPHIVALFTNSPSASLTPTSDL
jgi:hypothetical protein